MESDTLDRIAARVGAADWIPFRLMLETGIRVGDAVKSRYRDFYRGAGGEPRYRWIAEKTGKPGDTEISEHLFGIVTKGKHRGRDYVFPGTGKTGHITRQAIWARVKRAAALIGDTDGISPHSMRKIAAVRLRRDSGFQAAKAALQHSHDATAAIYAYADAMQAPDTPITWGELDLIADFVAAKVRDLLDKPAGAGV